MKFGLGPFPAVSAQDDADGYRTLLEHAALAEEEGFDSVWVDEGNQFGGGSPFVLAAAIATRTRAARIAVRPVVGLTHPFYTAEDGAALDNIANGRLIFAPRELPPPGPLTAYGVAPDEARERFWEALEVVGRAWAPDAFAHTGRFWTIPAGLPEHTHAVEFTKVSVTPKPAQPTVPTWVGAADDAGALRAAAHGLTVLGEASDHIDALAQRFAAHRAALGEAAARFATLRPAIRDMVIAETSDEAWRIATPALERTLPTGVGTGAGSVRERAAGRAVVGDVDTVIAELESYGAIGVNYVVCRLALPGLAAADVHRSLLLLGRGVAPHFRMFNLAPAVRARTLEEVGNPMIGYLSVQDPS